MDKDNANKVVAELERALQDTPPEKRESVIGAMIALERSSYSGPLPAPEDLKAYKEVMADAPEKIMEMAIRQQEHRCKMEEKLIEASIHESKRGQWMGIALALLFLASAIYLGIEGHDWLAGAIIAIIASVATIFVLKKEPQEKDIRQQ